MRNEIMTEYIEILQNSSLFYDISADDIVKLISCTNAIKKTYMIGEYVICQQDKVDYVGIVLKGSANGVKIAPTGKLTVLTKLLPGHVFGDVLAVSRGHKSPVTVVSAGTLEVLFVSYDAIFQRCADTCKCHNLLLKNLTQTISEKYFDLHDRLDCLLCSTLREKILTYFDLIAKQSPNASFNVPFNREGLAVYLNTDRSALSRELSNMKQEGILDYYKNTFRLTNIAENNP